MEYIKTFEGIFSSQPKEGDQYAKQLLKVAEEENIKISGSFESNTVYFRIDDIEYEFEPIEMLPLITAKYILKIRGRNINRTLTISKDVFKQAHELYSRYVRGKGELPDITDEARAAKKYNL